MQLDTNLNFLLFNINIMKKIYIIISVILILIILIISVTPFGTKIYNYAFTTLLYFFGSTILKAKDYSLKLISTKDTTSLKYFNKGKTQYNINYKKILDIGQATAITFIKNKMLILVRTGKIFIVKPEDNYQVKEIMDMNSQTNFTSEDTEQGLLGSTISNDLSLIYLSYTVTNNEENYKMSLVVNEYKLNNDKLNFIQNIITIPFKNTYHHAGTLQWGFDDHLYLSTGDGGPQGDPDNASQNPDNLWGKILKIDPKTKKIDIIALGLRNPWKFSFDNQKRIFIGDVGYNNVEKVCLVSDLKKKYNFGWSYFEGSRQLKPGKKLEDFDNPIFEYPTSAEQGRCIIGGYFIDKLEIYVFADFMGFIKIIKFNNNIWEEIGNHKLNNNELIHSLAKDNEKLYFTTNKSIYNLLLTKI